MMQQKKISHTHRRNITYKRQSKSVNDLTNYGPPKIRQSFIDASIGYTLKKQPNGLRKVKRDGAFHKNITDETISELAIRVGGTNILKRFKELKYLHSWTPKKSMYELCEESTVAKLYRSIVNVKHKKVGLSHRKCSSVIGY